MFIRAVKKSDLLLFFLSLILGLIVILPQLQVSELTPLDYDETLNWGRDTSIVSALKNSLTEKYRFIPVRYVNRYIQYNVFGGNSRIYYFMNGIELGLIIYLSLRVLGKFNLLKHVFFIAILLLLPQMVDGFYRIGTAEPLFTIFLLSCINFLQKGDFKWYAVFLLLFLMSKENALFIAPFLIMYSFIVFKHKPKFIFGVLAYITTFLLVIRSYLGISGERYFSQYSFDPMNIILNFSKYFQNDWPVFFLLIFSTVAAYLNRKNVRSDFELLLLCLGWTSLIPLMLLYESYYLFPTVVISLLVFLKITEVFNLDRFRVTVFFVVVTICFLVSQSSKTISTALSWHQRQVGDAALTNYLISQRGNADGKKYFLINKSLQNINGSWLIVSDFGREKVNFLPSADSAWDAYQSLGENGIDQLVDKARENYTPNPNNVLIENPCTDSELLNVNVTPLCKTSLVFKEPVCNWCIIK